MNWSLNESIGALHRIWYWALDFAEDGDLRRYDAGVIWGVVGTPLTTVQTSPEKFVSAMTTSGFFDSEPLRIHDWWDYAGRFLQVKYKHNPKKWKTIQRWYKGGSKNRSLNRSKNTIPNLTLPNQTKPKTFSSDSDEFRLAELLLSLMSANIPPAKPPKLQDWAMVVDFMRRRDGIKPVDIEAVIRWSQADSFWRANIRSAGSLREKYPQLKLKMDAHLTPKQIADNPKTKKEWRSKFSSPAPAELPDD